MLADQWGAIFSDELTLRISQINAVMKQHRSHLDTVYAEIRPDLLAEEQKGAVLARCWICEHEAHVVVAKGPEETACKVCTSRETFLRHTCEACAEDFLAEPVAGSQQCPHCSAAMSHTDIADAYTDEGAMSPHDALIDDASYGCCVECSTLESVGTVADRFFCFSCHTWHETMGHCEWCSSKTTGDVEDTYWNGCEQCEGRAAQG